MKGTRNQSLNRVGFKRRRSNSALVTDACGRRYRAFFNAAQRGR
jgi:hypothetical protein